MLSEHGHWAMDGTFKSCPSIFKIGQGSQIFVIGIFIRHRFFPCIYCLITRKNKPTFEEVFAAIKKFLPANLSPQSIVSDLTAISAFKKYFGNTRVQGFLNLKFSDHLDLKKI